MEITRETDYAIRCILYLANKNGDVTMVDEISREMIIPRSFLAKIMQKLARENVVKSFRGVKGGFSLARPAKEITLIDVITAIQGPIYLNKCVMDRKSCSRSCSCSVHPVWKIVGENLYENLRKYDFAALLEMENSAAIKI